MNSNSKTSVSGDLTSAKLINSVGEPVNRSSETADSSVIARSKRGITGDSSANVVAGEARIEDGSMIKQNIPQLKSFRDNNELFSRLCGYKPDIATCCKDVFKSG
ncbi:hypothetical protein Rs2_34437 [Raphanus sativus]|nr:hypothetical protein Rs2_34434 [Raphanus sativus]KAJ4884344.1 hypothetical protein Rs2_34437 [Raphanus sativus]